VERISDQNDMIEEKSFEYDIALSVADEDREIAEQTAHLLTAKNIKVFYDNFEKAKLWGEYLYERLAELYSKQARFCLMFISEHYEKKLWTRYERRNAQERAFEERGAYILPVRLDDTEIPGITKTIGCIDLRQESIEQLVKLIEEKLRNQSQVEKIPDQNDAQTQPMNRCDIFVSYASIDNEPLPGIDNGWVTTLIKGLENYLRQKLGGANAYSLWMNDKTPDDTKVPSHVVETIANSATFILILSPSYLNSPRCTLELETFLKNNNPEQVFIIERDQVELPKTLSNSFRYQFWENDRSVSRTLGMPQPNPTELEYYQKLGDLAGKLSEKLKFLEKPDNCTNQVVSNPIFLAEVSEDLKTQRDEMKRFLEQQGLPVLPNKEYMHFVKNDNDIKQQLDQDLSQSCLFVQLLSEKTGHGITQLQYKHAQDANLPILQYRNLALDLDQVDDNDYKTLLSNSMTFNCLADFQKQIIRKIKEVEEETDTKPIDNHHSVFINATNDDLDLAWEIQNFFDKRGITNRLPLVGIPKPIKIQKDLEDQLYSCEAVLILYTNNTPTNWVERQVEYCKRIKPHRENDYKIIAIYDQPSLDKQPLNIKSQVKLLTCPTSLAETCLPEFIRILEHE
jgi:hypothetical protein